MPSHIYELLYNHEYEDLDVTENRK
jgi:hypothetical protein